MKRNDLDFLSDHLDRHFVATMLVLATLTFVMAIVLSGCASAPPGSPCAGYFFCTD